MEGVSRPNPPPSPYSHIPSQPTNPHSPPPSQIQTGQVCWLEVPVTDVARASHFYTAVLGWESDATGAGTPSNLAGTKTVHFFQKGVMHGAFHLRDAAGVDVARPGSVTTFLVDSIDDTLAKAEAAGGKAVMYVSFSAPFIFPYPQKKQT